MLWFPCKYFSPNAFSLTLLTVAMKLPMDLTTSMMRIDEKTTKVSSLVMMATSIGNFMTAMARMDSNEILPSLSALGILVITVSGNVLIHNFQRFDTYDGKVVCAEEFGAVGFMLFFMVILVSLVVFIPTAKRYIESKYQEMHTTILKEIMEGRKLTFDGLGVVVKKYWVMAETGSSQFVMARSVVCSTSGLMCVLMALTLEERHIRTHFVYNVGYGGTSSSSYKWSMNYIMIIQSAGVALGEPELPQKTMADICNEVDKLIQKGKKQQPKNLIKLLQKSVTFNGVREFDSKEVPSLYSQEPPSSWSLAVVTLTSIAIALPSINNHKAKWLLTAVSEGLSFVKNIETTFDTKGEFLYIRNAADVTWVEVELYRTWQDKGLQETSLRDRTHKVTIQELSHIAEKAVLDFKNSSIDSHMENPQNWPVKIIAANLMYRITQTILLAQKDSNHQRDKFVFEKLSVVISDIVAACLTNLSRVITMKCHNDASKGREENVSQAAILLGESEKILEILQHHQSPGLDPDKAAYIEKWRASILASTSETGIPQINGEHVSIELES